MEQKLMITDSVYDVNESIILGWKIVSVTPQHVSTGGNSHLKGSFAIVLERPSDVNNVPDGPTYTEEEVSKLLEVQRGNCYVAIYNRTTSEELARVAGKAPEPGQWRK